MKQKKWIIYIIYFILSFITMCLCVTRTNPLYSLLMGDYEQNNVSAAILIGKYWAEGTKLPYKDLFSIGGPLYFFIQAIGWLWASRKGIFFLEIINMMIFLIVVHKIVSRFVSDKYAILLGILTLISYIAVCSGGNSAGEWCISLISLGYYIFFEDRYYEKFEIKLFILGLLTGLVCMIDIKSGGLLYGLVLGEIIYQIYLKKHSLIKGILSYLIGCVIPFGTCLIFFFANGCVGEFLMGTIVYPLKWLVVVENSLIVWIHKLAKCCLLLPMLAAGILAFYKKKIHWGLGMVNSSIVCMLLLMGGDNSWYFYIAAIPSISIGVATMNFFLKRKMQKVLSACICIVGVISICVIPLKNYISTLKENVAEVSEEFYTDLLEYQEQVQENGKEFIFLSIETDATYYLLTDTCPPVRYFTSQIDILGYDKVAGKKIQEEMEQIIDEIDALFISEKGYLGRDFEKFTLVQIYFMRNADNLFVYMPDKILFGEE